MKDSLKLVNTMAHPVEMPIPEDDVDDFTEVKSAIIFEASYLGEKVAVGFDAVRIIIDGKLKAELSWTKEIEAAKRYVNEGKRLFWEIDLGLFDQLGQPIESHTQFMALSLSLQHFRDTIWKEFRTQTVGLCLYRGTIDFQSHFPWTPEQQTNLQDWLKEIFGNLESFALETNIRSVMYWHDVTPELMRKHPNGLDFLRFFCCDVAGEYLDLLATQLPDTLPLFVLFDTTSIANPYVIAQLLTKERYPHLHVGVKESLCSSGQHLGGEISWASTPLHLGMIGKELSGVALTERAPLGVCLPKLSHYSPRRHEQLENIIISLHHKKTPFRIIPKELLSTEWDGLDELIVDPTSIDKQLERKLQGFRAAGGTVIFSPELV